MWLSVVTFIKVGGGGDLKWMARGFSSLILGFLSINRTKKSLELLTRL